MNSKCKESLNISMGEENGFLPLPAGFMTKAIHTAQDPEQWSSTSVIPPISMSATFKQTSPGEFKQYEYGRTGNPTRNLLEECLATLDGGKHCLAFASGMGAITAVVTLLKAGDHMISCDDIYGGTHRLFNEVIAQNNIETSFVDTTHVKNIEAAIRPNTRMLWIETPTNPTLRVSDIREISKICKQHDIIFAVDNSFLTPYFQRPLELGADISMYSLTKYMNGHADIIMGAVVLNDDALHTKLRMLQSTMGIIPSPFDCSQIIRGLKTLGVRMKLHSQNGVAVAKYLESHPKVAKVVHPGFPSHPQYEIFKKQCSGHSSMLCCYIKGGLAESSTFLNALKIFTTGASLGAIQSLIEMPALTSHEAVPKDERDRLGITDNFIRISVGLEDAEDLIADLEQALSLV